MPSTQHYLSNSPQNVPLIRLSSINPFLLELARRNAQPQELLRALDLPDTIPASGELFVSPGTIYEIVERSARQANDPYLGFRIGQSLELHSWEPISKAVSQASTVGELFLRFVMNTQEHASSALFFLDTEGSKSTFGFRRTTKPKLLPAQNDAFYLGFLSRMLMHATREHWDSTQAVFRVADPQVIPAMRDRLRIVEGGRRGATVRFPAEWLMEPFEKTTFVEVRPTDEIQHVPGSLVESMRLAIIPHLHEPDLSVERAAEYCGYNRRKLSSLLRNKGTTIAKEVAAMRADRARHLLVDSTQRVADIALAVGFSDPTVFSRAFKNWTGQSPQQFRRTKQNLTEGV
jgi:AraC-like DNA-binding protein